MATTTQAIPTGFPDASNTGVPVGTVLKTYTGPMTITKAARCSTGTRSMGN